MNHYINDLLDAKLEQIKNNENIYETGIVTKIQNYMIEIRGLETVSFFEQINIANKALGYVTAIKKSSIMVAVLKQLEPILVGDVVYATNKELTARFSTQSVGRIIDMFGEDKLTGENFANLVDIPVETPTIPIMDRGIVNRPFFTGITGIDLIYPIGKGQRQLIIGDKKIGKTQIILDTIVNQQKQNMLCIYIAIGKTKKEIKEIYQELLAKNALSYTILLTAFNDDTPPVLSLTPYVGLSIAERYMMAGRDVLVTIDDLKRHAEAYREISLLSGKNPGRDAYPADIFYTHSRLLEKGCQHKNGGSITILPIVETKGGDITDYISTNIISITDGQIVLSAKSFQKGEKPAIDYGLSVSRLGGAVQADNVKEIGSLVRRKLLSYLETREVYELANIDEMSNELQQKMIMGKKILDCLKQYKYSPRSLAEDIALFSFLKPGTFESKPQDTDAELLDIGVSYE